LFAQWFGSDHEVQTYGKSLDAVHNVMRALKAGDCTTAFVVAVEKKSDEQNLTDSSVKSIDPTLSVFNWDWQSIYASMACEYFSKTEHRYEGADRMQKYKAFYHDLMAMGLNDAYNAGKLPFKDVLKSGKKKASRASFDPLTAFDFADNEMDGACAMVLMPKKVADAKGITPLATLHASVSRTNSSEFWQRSDITQYPALISASKELCDKMRDKACISNDEVSVYSIDTKVTMAGPLVLEGLGVIPHPAIPEIAKAVYKAQDPAYPYKHIVFERNDGSKFVVNPTGGTYVNGNLPGLNGLYQMIKVIENMRGAGKPLPVDGRYAVIHDQSSGGDKQNLVLMEVNKEAKR
jgi:acetyl-CoA acetyltransferase